MDQKKSLQSSSVSKGRERSQSIETETGVEAGDRNTPAVQKSGNINRPQRFHVADGRFRTNEKTITTREISSRNNYHEEAVNRRNSVSVQSEVTSNRAQNMPEASKNVPSHGNNCQSRNRNMDSARPNIHHHQGKATRTSVTVNHPARSSDDVGNGGWNKNRNGRNSSNEVGNRGWNKKRRGWSNGRNDDEKPNIHPENDSKQNKHAWGAQGNEMSNVNRNQRRETSQRGGMDRNGSGGWKTRRNASNAANDQIVSSQSQSGSSNFNRRSETHRTFFGFKKLENYLKVEADSVVISLHSDIVAFESYLNENKAYEGNMFDLLLTVLSEKVFSDESNLVSYQNDIVRVLATTEIMNRFRDKCMTLDESKFKQMYDIVDFMKRRMPVSAADSLSGLVTFCMARLGMFKDDPKSAELYKLFESLFQSFQQKKQNEETEAKARKMPVRGKFTEYDLKSFDKLKPPEDFREIRIIPTIPELLSSQPSFLRPNKQYGSYTDAEHYLDVQFRLLREDFLQPLKQGIQEYLALRKNMNNPRLPKGSPIRLYYDVKVITSEVKNENLHYWIQLPADCSKIKWEKSRRLLPGNLVLLTRNTKLFDSVVFAIVGLRNDDDLKKHRKLTIIPENSPSCNIDVLCDDTDLLLIESEVYWESFRHVLKTTQTLNLNTFPLAKYIVRACNDVEAPPALIENLAGSQIDLYSGSKAYSVSPLMSDSWPTAELLGLDANQFDAFKAALTKQFVIIQGPPGTGKTFVGLRIAEVFLQNTHFRTGRREHPAGSGNYLQYEGPLLCICYTNHALDQFLEGVLNIMNDHDIDPKIVRVGGRSKSTVLSEFNLRDIVRREHRRFDGLQWSELRDIEAKMKKCEASIRNLKQITAELQRPTGIVQFEKLENAVYQTLCFEFSSQLMEKFSSPTFFKLTHSDVCHIKEVNATDVVKRWFDYVKANKTVKAEVKARKGKEMPKEAQVEGQEEDEEFYDIDELMEHRIVDDYNLEPAELVARFKFNNSMGGFYVDNMSIHQSKYLVLEYENFIQKHAIKDNDPLNTVYEKQRNIAHVNENISLERKRLNILTEIFHCLNEKRVIIPDVTEKLESLRRYNTMDSKNFVDRTFPLVAHRYAAYLIVAKRAKQLMIDVLREHEMEMMENARIIAQLKRKHEVEILKNAKVVGMTTTGAAKFNDLLVRMKCRIVIVEEAAEVLEAHIVTSLTKYTDHLILIGDHKQLKPSTAVYDLARKYDLDVSLFERMINNNMTCYSLLAQHRMRSDIADLIRGSIYENLNDAPNVHDYQSITGMTTDLFFLSHDKFEKSEGDTLSKLNEFEAEYLVGLADYLLKQGYKASSITVLTTYTGQMFLLKSKFRGNDSQRIHITCVDNFQGEENDIILLSLVRSNPEGKMGFLSVSNRVCVALSRAKKGLYIIGNMGMLSKQTIWSEINAKLKGKGQIGNVMKVVCQSHNTQSDIANGEDFYEKCPEGGCSKMCGLLMQCSHYCPRFCHTIDLNHEDYTCRERCRKPCLSSLAHPCTLQCHFKKVCMPCNVLVHKPRSCGHDISVECHLSAEEGYCCTKIKRLLKCDHEVDVDCSQKMDDYLCREVVDKILDCGHETKLMCHVNPNQFQCKIEVKKKLPCTHYRNMKCFQQPESSMCKTFVEKELPCGHNETIECRFDPKKVVCSVKCNVTLECEHTVVVPCFRKTSGKIECPELCEERLGCGHSCPQKCHHFKDRHHDKFRCKKPCAKSCPEGHPCVSNHECSSQCKKCVTVVERKLPDCGHVGKMFCFESLTKHKCEEKCAKELLCKHICGNKCSESCGPCKEIVTKKVPICGHSQLVPCAEDAVLENCKENIEIGASLCGHKITVACNMRNAPLQEIQKHCTVPCDFMFPADNGCGHICSGTCGSCLMGSLHQKCKDKCSRPLICGHLCNFPCSKNCPPCKYRCQMKCEHSKCKKMCGDACFICKERCSWKCKHERCTNLCGEMCNRGPCHENCDKKLSCGHPCIGFCGEVCPPLCRICHSDQLTEFQLLFTEGEDDARFIWLPDCKHAIEVEGLTMHFSATDDSGEIGLKRCPRCTTVITTLSGRFGNIIRKTFRDVAQVKNKFYGNREQNQRLTEEIQQNLQLEENKLNDNLPSIKKFFEKIIYFEDKSNSLTKKLRQVDMHTLNSLQQIWIWVKETLKNLSDYSDDVIVRDCDSIFSNITKRQLPLCAFETSNISNEIQRLVHKIQFYRRWNSAPKGNKDHADAKALHTQILATLLSKGVYDVKSQQNVIDNTKNLEKLLKTGLGISDHERLEIVKAMNMKQGHWFKCPNGHFYAIGECGGAMETAKCNECGETIGGANHSLLQNNQLAPEMDGAVRPAWDTMLVPQNFGF